MGTTLKGEEVMPYFGYKSKKVIDTLHPDLQMVLIEAINYYDFSVTDGYRSPEYQQALFDAGKSEVKPGPKAKHTLTPSEAVDIYPYPINLKQLERCYFLAGVIFTVAKQLDIKIRWGGDWNMNMNFYDQKFFDLGHFELV